MSIVNPTYAQITGDYDSQTIAYDWQMVTGAFVTDADVFYGATATASYAIVGGLFSDSDTFFSATVTRGTVTISATLFSDPDAFYGATATARYTVSGALFTDPDAFYAANVTGGGAAPVGIFGQGGSHGEAYGGGSDWDELLEELAHVAGPIKHRLPTVREAAKSLDAAITVEQAPAPINTGRLVEHAELLHSLLLAADTELERRRAEKHRLIVLEEVRRIEAIARARRQQEALVRRRQAEDDEMIEILLMSA